MPTISLKDTWRRCRRPSANGRRRRSIFPARRKRLRMSVPLRSTAREIFEEALAECAIEKAFARSIDYDRGVLRICEDLYDLRSYSRVMAVSFGKARHRMADALVPHV